MLDTLNGLDEVAWAGIAALVSVIVGGIGAAIHGMNKHPTEVGNPLPPADQTPYVLAEVRALIVKHEEGSMKMEARFSQLAQQQAEACKLCDHRFDDLERLGNRIHTDTQVLRERDPRR